jgi:hypothetical protein
MLTLADISLAVARIVTPENIVSGTATAGATTSLTDTVNLTTPTAYFDKGILWIQSGTNSGKVLTVTGNPSNKLNFAAITDSIAAGDRYSVARPIYPYNQIVSAIHQALDETYVEGEDATLTGDGTTLEFTLPSGVWDIKKVRIEHASYPEENYFSAHWKEQGGKIKFDYGYAPDDDYSIRLYFRDQHPQLTAATSEIDAEIDTNWLKYKASEALLLWGMGVYKAAAEYRIEERMNLVLARLKTLSPRRGGPDMIVRSAASL